jgi:lysozyme
MKTSPQGVSLIKRFEGFRSHPYQCQAGVWTIGYGHTRGITQDSPPVTAQQADAMLLLDIARYERSVLRLIGVKLNQRQFDALVSFTFNLGGAALQRSSLRSKLNRGEYAAAGAEFLKWVRAGGVVRKGLVKRREAESAMFLAGID